VGRYTSECISYCVKLASTPANRQTDYQFSGKPNTDTNITLLAILAKKKNPKCTYLAINFKVVICSYKRWQSAKIDLVAITYCFVIAQSKI
jgi:hypothetical protein